MTHFYQNQKPGPGSVYHLLPRQMFCINRRFDRRTVVQVLVMRVTSASSLTAFHSLCLWEPLSLMREGCIAIRGLFHLHIGGSFAGDRHHGIFIGHHDHVLTERAVAPKCIIPATPHLVTITLQPILESFFDCGALGSCMIFMLLAFSASLQVKPLAIFLFAKTTVQIFAASSVFNLSPQPPVLIPLVSSSQSIPLIPTAQTNVAAGTIKWFCPVTFRSPKTYKCRGVV